MKLKDIIKLCGSVKKVKIKINDGYGEEELRLNSILNYPNVYFNIKEATVESLEVQNDALVILIEDKPYY